MSQCWESHAYEPFCFGKREIGQVYTLFCSCRQARFPSNYKVALWTGLLRPETETRSGSASIKKKAGRTTVGLSKPQTGFSSNPTWEVPSSPSGSWELVTVDGCCCLLILFVFITTLLSNRWTNPSGTWTEGWVLWNELRGFRLVCPLGFLKSQWQVW